MFICRILRRISVVLYGRRSDIYIAAGLSHVTHAPPRTLDQAPLSTSIVLPLIVTCPSIPSAC